MGPGATVTAAAGGKGGKGAVGAASVWEALGLVDSEVGYAFVTIWSLFCLLAPCGGEID